MDCFRPVIIKLKKKKKTGFMVVLWAHRSPLGYYNRPKSLSVAWLTCRFSETFQ